MPGLNLPHFRCLFNFLVSLAISHLSAPGNNDLVVLRRDRVLIMRSPFFYLKVVVCRIRAGNAVCKHLGESQAVFKTQKTSLLILNWVLEEDNIKYITGKQ